MYTDWQSRPEDYYAFDIETDDLNATRVWVMCTENIRTGDKRAFTDYSSILNFFRDNPTAIFIGHNSLKFDAPTLNRLLGTSLSPRNVIDTLVLSTLYSPDIDSGHSLDAWAVRMGTNKIQFNDWSRLSKEMIEYCHQDVSVTAQLFRRLIRTMVRIGFTEQSIWLQHHLTCVIHQQSLNGFYFDGKRALELYGKLRSIEAELVESVRDVFPDERKYVATRQMYKKNGDPTAIYLTDQERYHIVVGNEPNTYLAFEDIPFNLGSYAQRTQRLLDLGWENLPDEVTKGGNPKPFDKGDLVPSLQQFIEENPMPEVMMIAKWMAINGRATMINTWLDNWNEKDFCIHGKLFVANTLRFRHQAPNTANIPAVRLDNADHPLLAEEGFFTYEARDLWTSRPGRILVGTDAAGLELRMLAHYLDRPAFTDQVVNGDPHQYNADQVGITRPQAKTLLYSIMYGAAAPKIAKTLKVSVKEASIIRTTFLERLGLKDLIDDCKTEQSKGRIELVDGSQVICPSPHAALNYKLQGGGARVMGLSAVLADREVRRNGWDVLKVGDIHDEDQSDCDPSIADDFGKMREESIAEAGRKLKLNVPLAGEYKKGRTWAETH
jgi:DNA polymerase-1